jgi:hypothetical protein
MSDLVPPHGGGEINSLLLSEAERPAAIACARDLLQVPMSSREVSDTLMLAMGDYYGPFDAHHIFDKLWPDALVPQALKTDLTFFCKKCHGMATGKTCLCGENDRVNISGTELREMLSKSLEVPIEFGRPEVVAIPRKYYATLDQ